MNPHDTAGLLVLRDNGELLGTDAVRWAVDALADGYDTPSLRILAGLDLDGLPNAFETEKLLEASLRELGVPEGDRMSRALEYVRELAAAIVAEEIAPQEGADLIHRRVISPLSHPSFLQAWCYLWEGNSADCSRALHDSELDEAIIDYATNYLGTTNESRTRRPQT